MPLLDSRNITTVGSTLFASVDLQNMQDAVSAMLLNSIMDDFVYIKNIGEERKPLDLPPLKYE